MKVKGTIFVFNNPKTKRVEVMTSNCGESPGELTHNILPSKDLALGKGVNSTHDDHIQFGHGNVVPEGTAREPGTTQLNFPIGGDYNTRNNGRREAVRIGPGKWLRVGFRYAAWQAVQIPRSGEIVAIPYERMRRQPDGKWRPQRMSRRTKAYYPPHLQAALRGTELRVVQGRVRVVPVPDAYGRLLCWEVWFENQAKNEKRAIPGQTFGFTGTAVLQNNGGQGQKNAGLGLESMPCPGPETSARQVIFYGGDYGVAQFGLRALEGTTLRLGVRGHSSTMLKLPSLEEGVQTVALSRFERTEENQQQAEWFDGELLRQKMGEKKARIDLFRGKQRLNDRLPDTVYEGEEAFTRAEFKVPPRVQIAWLPRSKELPKGGWKITMTSHLPPQDAHGPLGFGASFKLRQGKQLAGHPALAVKHFDHGTRHQEWILPAGTRVGEKRIGPGEKLVIDTGPLGWRGSIKLPKAWQASDSGADRKAMIRSWVLRESDYQRVKLYPRA